VWKFASGAIHGVAGAKAPVRLSRRRFSLRFIEKKNGGGTIKKALAFYQNLLYFKFDASTRSNFRGFFGR